MICFSIIIPTYNRAAFLSKAIDSVLAQTYTNWELLIVDDGSTDNTKEVVSAYTDNRIKYIYQQNAERSAARNNGIAHAQGDYICFLDSDNYMLADRLEKLSDVISEYSEKSCFYTDIEYILPDGEKIVKYGKSFSFPVCKNELIQQIIATPQLCCRRQILLKHQFNQYLTIGEDMELIFRITNEFPLIYLPDNITIVEIEHKNRSVNSKSKSSEKQLKTLQVMFNSKHPASKASNYQKRKLRSAVLYNASYDYLLSNNIKGIIYIIKSILTCMWQPTTKYKINIIFTYFFRKNLLPNLLKYE